MVSGCYRGSETGTLNSKLPMLQSVIQSWVSPSGIWVLWWLRNRYVLTNPYFEPQIPNGSKSHTFMGVTQWYLSAVVAQKPVL